MDDIHTWKRLLAEIREDKSAVATHADQLISIFEHLRTEVAPRLQKEYDACTCQTEKTLGGLFDVIDLSDKQLLVQLLRLLHSFGFLRIAQIAYHVQDSNHDPTYFPAVEKTKWHDMRPLLPQAGTIGWKGIMNHGLVRDEPELSQACIDLLLQKLHFFSIISLSDGYQPSKDVILRCGQKVAKKLFEMIRDTAYDRETTIGLNSMVFNLLTQFSDKKQQLMMIDAVVQDMIKPFFSDTPVREIDANEMFDLVHSCILNRINLQGDFIDHLLNQLRQNIIRRKRRHSVESSQRHTNVTLESLVEAVSATAKLDDLISKVEDVEISKKSLQSKFLRYWCSIVTRVASVRSLTHQNSLKLIGATLLVLASTYDLIDNELCHNLTLIVVKCIDNVGNTRPDVICSTINYDTLSRLIAILKTKSETIDTSFKKMLVSNLVMHLKYSFRKNQSNKLEKFSNFARQHENSEEIQQICVSAIATCLASYKGKPNDTVEAMAVEAKLCGKRLHKSIKNNLKMEIEMDDGEEEKSNKCVIDSTLESLVNIIQIAVMCKNQELLDSFRGSLVKLVQLITDRLELLITASQSGSLVKLIPSDHHITKIITLLFENKEMTQPYLSDGFEDQLVSLFIPADKIQADLPIKSDKKVLYNQLKSKIEILVEKEKKIDGVYQNIINKQYMSATYRSIGSAGSMKIEKQCNYCQSTQMKILRQVFTVVLMNCDTDLENKAIEKVTSCLDLCDPLDHPKVLYSIQLVDTVISQLSKMQENIPSISCSLIRISKSVELGPSIHAFTNSGVHKSAKAIQCCTYASCIKLYSTIFNKYDPKLTNPLIAEAMQLCVSADLLQYAKYGIRLHTFFNQLACTIIDLLKSISIGYKGSDVLKSSMPIFLSTFGHLIKCLIIASDKKMLLNLPKENGTRANSDNLEDSSDDESSKRSANQAHENELEMLALDIARMLNNMSFLKIKLIDYAPHLISNYIMHIQLASCPDYVKQHLNEGMFRIFNLVDAHQKERQEKLVQEGVQRKTIAGQAKGSLFEMIHARLDQASREIFKDLHDNYNRFHRYLGKC